MFDGKVPTMIGRSVWNLVSRLPVAAVVLFLVAHLVFPAEGVKGHPGPRPGAGDSR